MKIHILTDSLGGPRTNESEEVYYRDTWISKIVDEFGSDYTISSLVRHSLHSSEAIQNLDKYVNGFEPDILIIQLGIVDSFPRVLLQKERFLIMRLPFKLGHFFVSKIIRKIYPHFTKIIKRNEVNISQFEKNVKLLKKCASQVHFIPIMPACSEYLKISPTANKRIKEYNQILHSETSNIKLFSEFLNDSNFKSGCYVIDDYHHLNKLGHNKVHLYLRKVLSSDI